MRPQPPIPALEPLSLMSVETVASRGTEAVKLTVSIEYSDQRGARRKARAHVYLPQGDARGRLPLIYQAGYEIDDALGALYVSGGYACVNPITPTLEEAGGPDNPLVRGPNLDIALLHAARSLEWVDDSKVVIAGGSASGHMSLMLAAETFPVSAVVMDCAPVNLAYNMAYFWMVRKLNEASIFATQATQIAADAVQLLGEDFSTPPFIEHSVISHLAKITCPISGNYSTADMLVPAEQLSRAFDRGFNKEQFPEGFIRSPEKLTDDPRAHLRLDDLLGPDVLEFVIEPPPPSAERVVIDLAPEGTSVGEIAAPVTDKQWTVLVIDEGPPEPDVGHVKHAIVIDRTDFLNRWVTGEVGPEQLTPAKLQTLLMRWSGQEWISPSFRRLDDPEREKKDVIRGLKTFLAGPEENARHLESVISELSLDLRPLAEEVAEKCV